MSLFLALTLLFEPVVWAAPESTISLTRDSSQVGSDLSRSFDHEAKGARLSFVKFAINKVLLPLVNKDADSYRIIVQNSREYLGLPYSTPETPNLALMQKHEEDARDVGGKGAGRRQLENLRKTHPELVELFDLAEAELIGREIYDLYYDHNQSRIAEAHRFLDHLEASGKELELYGDDYDKLKKIVDSFEFPEKAIAILLKKIEFLNGRPGIARSSEAKEDSYVQSFAGHLISLKFNNAEEFVEAIKRIYADTAHKKLIDQNIKTKRVKGFPNRIRKEDVLGIEVDEFIEGEFSGTITSQTHRGTGGYTLTEVVEGGAKEAVGPNAKVWMFLMNFNAAPFPDGEMISWRAPSRELASQKKPLTNKQVMHLQRIAFALHQSLDHPVDLEFIWPKGRKRPYIVQCRPYLGSIAAMTANDPKIADTHIELAETAASIGITPAEGIELPVVIFAEKPGEDMLVRINAFEEKFKRPYIGIFHGAAAIALYYETSYREEEEKTGMAKKRLCQLFIDPDVNSRNAHGVHAIGAMAEGGNEPPSLFKPFEAIRKMLGVETRRPSGIRYANGYEIDDTLETLPYKEYGEGAGIFISQKETTDGFEEASIRYVSNGIMGKVYLRKDENYDGHPKKDFREILKRQTPSNHDGISIQKKPNLDDSSYNFSVMLIEDERKVSRMFELVFFGLIKEFSPKFPKDNLIIYEQMDVAFEDLRDRLDSGAPFPRFVVTDLQTPGPDVRAEYLNFLKQLQEMDKRIKIVIFTGSSDKVIDELVNFPYVKLPKEASIEEMKALFTESPPTALKEPPTEAALVKNPPVTAGARVSSSLLYVFSDRGLILVDFEVAKHSGRRVVARPALKEIYPKTHLRRSPSLTMV